MALRDQIRVPLKDYADGEEILLGSVSALARKMALTLDRCTSAAPNVWSNPAHYVECELFVSEDGGKTWTPSGGWGAFGGVHVRRDGTEATFSGIVDGDLPKRGLCKLVIRATDTATGQPVSVRTAGTLRTFDEDGA